MRPTSETKILMLHVEDDPGAARLLQRKPGRRGCLVDLASDGRMMANPKYYKFIANSNNFKKLSEADRNDLITTLDMERERIDHVADTLKQLSFIRTMLEASQYL